jgi:putative transposase
MFLWHEIPNHAQNVKLVEFLVMPNHVHGVLIFNNYNKIAKMTMVMVT